MKEIFSGIGLDPAVQGGAPVVLGTRVPVSVVLDQLACGVTVDEIAKQYHLTRDNVFACIRFASQEITRLEFSAA